MRPLPLPLAPSALFPLVALLAPPLAAEVIVVDSKNGAGTDFTDLQLAVDAAQDGDVLLVRASSYGPVSIVGKALTLVGQPDAQGNLPHVTTSKVISLVPLVVELLPSEALDLGPGQALVVRDLRFDRFHVRRCAGPVWIEGGEFGLYNQSAAGLEVEDSPAVLLVDAEATGATGLYPLTFGFNPLMFPSPGIAASGSQLALEGGLVVGGQGFSAKEPSALQPALPGEPGVRVDGGAIFAAEAEVFGGSGGHVNGNGLFTAPCGPSGDGGAGIALDGAAALRLGGTTQGGSPGSTDGVCPGGQPPADGQPGPAVALLNGATDALQPGTVLQLASTSPVREGEVASLQAKPFDAPSLPAGSVGLAVLGHAPLVALGGGPVAAELYVAGPFVIVPLPSGTVSYSAIVPELGAGVESAPVYAQAWVLLPTGAVVRTAPTALTLLDAAL